MTLRTAAAACLAVWTLNPPQQADAFGLGLRPTTHLCASSQHTTDPATSRAARGMTMYSAFKKKGGGGKKKGGGSKTAGTAGGKAGGKGGGKGRGEGGPPKPVVDTSRKVGLNGG